MLWLTNTTDRRPTAYEVLANGQIDPPHWHYRFIGLSLSDSTGGGVDGRGETYANIAIVFRAFETLSLG